MITLSRGYETDNNLISRDRAPNYRSRWPEGVKSVEEVNELVKEIKLPV